MPTRSVKPAVVLAHRGTSCRSLQDSKFLLEFIIVENCVLTRVRSKCNLLLFSREISLFVHGMARQHENREKVTNKCERKPKRRTTGQCQCLNVFIYGGE